MKAVKRWRYYCEFCKNVGGSKYHMERHEKGCTNNPDRVCGMCRVAELEQKPLSDLIAVINEFQTDPKNFETIQCFDDSYEEFTKEASVEMVDRLLELTNGCPSCVLAALRQSNATYVHDVFNFQKERAEFWEEYNEVYY